MPVVANVLVALVAVAHLYFFILESFLWRTPLGLKTFRMDSAKAEMTAVLAQNQGVYNAFLAAGLVWGIVAGGAEGLHVKTFFLGCVIVAGLVGAATVSKRILMVQALPAALALVATWVVHLS